MNYGRWDEYGMAEAQLSAAMSKDPSTQVGCAILDPHHMVRAKGFNGFPRRCDDSSEIYANRSRKHLRVVHAEANAVASAAFAGVSLAGCVAYVTKPCCAQCAALLIQAGISRVVWPKEANLALDWMISVNEGLAMLYEAGVTVDRI